MKKIKGLVLAVIGLFVGLTQTGFAADNGNNPSFRFQTENIVITPTHLSNSQFDNLIWEYSIFGKNGSNVVDIGFNVCSSLNIDGYYLAEFVLSNRNYLGQITSSQQFQFTDDKETCSQQLNDNVKRDLLFNLFDRRNDGGANGSFVITNVLSDEYTSAVIDITFRSSFSLVLNNALLSAYVSSTGAYDTKPNIMLYDKNDNLMTKITSSANLTTSLVNYKFDLPNRVSEVWRVGLGFNWQPRSQQAQSIYIKELNGFSNNIIFKPSFDGLGSGDLALPLPIYQSCSTFDFMCHLNNFATWLVRDFPPTQIMYTGFNYILTFFISILGMFTGLFGLTISGSSIISSKFTGIFGYVMLVIFAMVMWRLIKWVGGLFT